MHTLHPPHVHHVATPGVLMPRVASLSAQLSLLGQSGPNSPRVGSFIVPNPLPYHHHHHQQQQQHLPPGSSSNGGPSHPCSTSSIDGTCLGAPAHVGHEAEGRGVPAGPDGSPAGAGRGGEAQAAAVPEYAGVLLPPGGVDQGGEDQGERHGEGRSGVEVNGVHPREQEEQQQRQPDRLSQGGCSRSEDAQQPEDQQQQCGGGASQNLLHSSSKGSGSASPQVALIAGGPLLPHAAGLGLAQRQEQQQQLMQKHGQGHGQQQGPNGTATNPVAAAGPDAGLGYSSSDDVTSNFTDVEYVTITKREYELLLLKDKAMDVLQVRQNCMACIRQWLARCVGRGGGLPSSRSSGG